MRKLTSGVSEGMPIDLLSRARELSEKNQKSIQDEKERKLKEQKDLESRVESLAFLVRSELDKLSGQQTKYGTIQLSPDNSRSYGVFAYLEVGSKKMAWFKAYIESGTWDPSDEIRNEPYTDPKVKCRFYPPNPTRGYDDSWDTQESFKNNNGGFEFSCTDREDRIAQFFESLAKGLVSWI